MVRHPRGSYIVTPLLSLEVSTPENKSIHWTLSSIRKESPPHKRFVVGCSSPFVRLARQLTALCSSCKQCVPGGCKSDVPRPGIVGMRGSMVIRPRPCMTWVHLSSCNRYFSLGRATNVPGSQSLVRPAPPHVVPLFPLFVCSGFGQGE